MLKLPLVTIVVTSYNYEKYILKTLESIKLQTYKNIEIIVVDDASSDNSIELLEKQEGINLIKHAKNLGQLASIIDGLKSANGQFISFVDSDDILMPEYVKTLLQVHLSTDVAFASSQLVEIDENDTIHTIHSPSAFKSENRLKTLDELLNTNSEKPEFKVINTKTNTFGGWWWSPMGSAMFRKSAIDLVINYKTPEDWRVCPDKFLFNFAHLIGGSALVNAPLLASRRHSDNAGCGNIVTGDTRYNNDEVTKLNIENNKKIRRLTRHFIKSNRAKFNKMYGKINVKKMIFTIYLSYFYIAKQVKDKIFN